MRTRLSTSANFHGRTSQVAPDGKVVLVQGYIKFIDYLTSLEALKAFPKMMTTYGKFLAASSAKPGQAQARGATNAGPSKSHAEALGPIVESLSKVAGTNLSDFVRVKIVPDIDETDHAFVGDAQRDCFRYQSALLSTLYPGGVAEGWTPLAVLQAHKSKTQTFQHALSLEPFMGAKCPGTASVIAYPIWLGA